MSIKYFAATVAAALVASPTVLLAQNARTDANTSVEEIVVTASPLGSNELHLAQPVTVLSGETLANNMASSIGETLSHQLGISSTAFGAGASRPVIRGQSGSRVRLLQNGISSMDVSNLSPDHAISIEPLVATQIEVLKGPATLLYGSGASGGVVNVVTNRIATKLPAMPSLRMETTYNTVSNERAGVFTADTSVDDVAFHLDGAKRVADDFTIPGYASLTPQPGDLRGSVPHSDLETHSLNGGATYIGDAGSLGMDLDNYSTEYGIPGEGSRIQLHQKRYDIKGELKAPFEAIEKIKFQLGHVDYNHKELEPTGDVGTTFLNKEYEGRMEVLHTPINNWHGALGVQLGHRDFAAIGEEALTPPLTQKSQGVFLVEEHDQGDWHTELGGRVEQQHIYPKDNSPTSSHFTYSLSGGTVWEFDPSYSVGLYLSRAQRAPSLEELYNHGPHAGTATYEIGNINLQRETANNVDLTFRGQHGALDWRVNLFANQIQNYIFGKNVDANNDGIADRVDAEGNLTTADDSLLLVNYAQQKARLYGLEAEATMALGTLWQGDVDGRVSFDYVRGKLVGSDNLPRMTPMRIGAGFDYHQDNWTGIFDVYHVFKQDQISALETTTASYTLLEAAVTYAITSKAANYEFSLRGRNLLNEEARVHTSFLKDIAPLPGRGVILSLQVSF